MNSTITRIGVLAAAAALTLSLASCSSEQSVAEACQVAETSMDKASDAYTSAMTDLQNGGDLSQLIAPMVDIISEAQSKVSNKEVSDTLGEVADSAAAAAETLKGFEMPNLSEIDYTDPGAMAEFEKISQKAEKVAGALEEQGKKITAASEKLEALCGA